MNSEPDPSGFLPVDKGTAQNKTADHSTATGGISVDEKAGRLPDSPDVAEGEMRIVDKDGNVDVIRESDYSPEEYKTLLRKIDRFLLPLMWFCYGIQQTYVVCTSSTCTSGTS